MAKNLEEPGGGIATSARVVQRHGSAPERGSIIAPQKNERPRFLKDVHDSGEPVNDAYILLVEDREEDVELTLRAFKKAHIVNEIVVKRDGLEALQFLESLAGGPGERGGEPKRELPTLVLLDVSMPRMNGIEVLEKVRGLDFLRCVPIVMLTSSNEERDLVASYEHGANSYVRKPVAFTDFAALIARLGMYWVVTNEVPSREVQAP